MVVVTAAVAAGAAVVAVVGAVVVVTVVVSSGTVVAVTGWAKENVVSAGATVNWRGGSEHGGGDMAPR